MNLSINEKIFELENETGRRWAQLVARFFKRPMAVEVETGDFLYGLVRAIKPFYAVEVGTFEGFSAVNIAQAIRDNGAGFLYTIDYKDYGCKKLFKEYCLNEYIDQVIGLSPYELEKVAISVPINFAFLDGEHSYEAVLSKLIALHKHIIPGCFIACHDSIRYSCIHQAVNDFCKEYSNLYEKLEISTYAGIYLVKRVA